MASQLEAKKILKQKSLCEIYKDHAPATCNYTHKSSLSDLTGIPRKILKQKYGLFPWYKYRKDKSENVGFMSPLLLLDDSLLQHGGVKDMGAEKLLSLVTKDILEKKDLTSFQVPELTCLHMGYGKTSNNKEGRLAISEKDAKAWFEYLTLRKLEKYLTVAEQTEGSDSASQTRRAAEDFDRYDDFVSGSDSGLCNPRKGSQILCLSILAINSKSRKRKSVTNQLNLTEHEGTIGPNKISDFLSFWTLPYLLNFSQRKVEEICKFHKANERNPHDIVKTVQKSALDIYKEAIRKLKSEVQDGLKEKLKKFYGGEKLRKQYTLLECNGSAIVLVPCQYIYHQRNPVPLCLEDMGHKWKKDDRLMSAEEFLTAFINDREVQEDYFNCMKDAGLRQAVDYAIIFPDESVFKLLSQALEPDMMMVLKHVKSQGRGMITPSHSVVKCSGSNAVVCFSYLQGTDDSSISGLFRATGAHYCNNFSVIFLHGATRSKDDLVCRLGNLYTVQEAEQFSFKKGKLQKPQCQISFSQGRAQFTAHGFPSCYDWWRRRVMKDPDFSSAASEYNIDLTFDPSKHLKVAFTSSPNQDKLRNICLEKRERIHISNEKRMTKQGIHAVSLDGTLLSKIHRCGREDNIGVTLGVINTLGPDDPPPTLKHAVDKNIFYLALAFIKADLREVFPSEPDEKDREEIEGKLLSSASSSLSSSEESEEESVEEASGKRVRKRLPHRTKRRKRLRKSTKLMHNFEDDDGNNEEEDKESDSGFGHYEEMRRESQDKRHSPQKRVADPAEDPDQSSSNVDCSYKSGKRQKGESTTKSKEQKPGAARKRNYKEMKASSVKVPTEKAGTKRKKKNGLKEKVKDQCQKMAPKQSRVDEVSTSIGKENELSDVSSTQTVPNQKVKASRPRREKKKVKSGVPTREELESLGQDIGDKWKVLGRRLKVSDSKLDAIDADQKTFPEKGYEMLKHWAQKRGNSATYRVLSGALKSELLERTDLAEKYCYS